MCVNPARLAPIAYSGENDLARFDYPRSTSSKIYPASPQPVGSTSRPAGAAFLDAIANRD